MAYNLKGAEELLSFREGTDISVDVEMADEGGNALDLTGYSAQMRIGLDYDTPAELTLTVGAGIAIDTATGVMTFSLTNAQTDALTFKQGRYDLEIIDSDGNIDPVMSGRITIGQRVPDEE
jgi:hypothetical protein